MAPNNRGGAGGAGAGGAEPPPGPLRDPGLQPERTALSWRRTIMSAVVADVLIWRAWFTALADPLEGAGLDARHSAQVVGLGVCAVVACLTTVVLVLCAAHRIRCLHAGVGALAGGSHIGVSALTVRTASAAIVALALAAMGALALGF